MINFFVNLSPVLQSLIATIFTFLVTALGSAFVFFFKKVNRSLMDGMLGFAAGVMIAASFWSLLNPAIDMAINLDLVPWLMVSVGFISGGLLLFVGDKICNKILNKNEKYTDRRNSLKRCFLLIFSITLHNIPEGLAVGVGFGSLYHGTSSGTLLGACALAFGIGLQNFPEGTAVSLPLRREGYSRRKSFFYGGLSGIVEPISGVLGALLVIKIERILPFLLAFAAGSMIYVVVQELIPESQSNKDKGLMALFSLFGFTLMMILDVALG